MNDLLRLDAPPREVRWSSKDGFYVENLLLVDCETLDDVFSVLDEGSRNRKVIYIHSFSFPAVRFRVFREVIFHQFNSLRQSPELVNRNTHEWIACIDCQVIFRETKLICLRIVMR